MLFLEFDVLLWATIWIIALTLTLFLLRGVVKFPFKRKYHMVYIVFLSLLSILSVVNAFAYLGGEVAAYVDRVVFRYYFAPIFVALAYHFSLYFITNTLTRSQKFTLSAVYSTSLFFTAAFITDSSLIVAGGREGLFGQIIIRPGPIAYLYTIYIAITLFFTARAFLIYYKKHQSPFVKQQTLYLLLGMLLIIGGRLAANLLRFDLFFIGFNPSPILTILGVVLQITGLRKHWFEAIDVVQIQAKGKQDLVT
jgi:hypothetical protein